MVTITVSAGTAGKPSWILITGTKQEIVTELQNQNMTPSNIASFIHDGTDYIVVCSRQG